MSLPAAASPRAQPADRSSRLHPRTGRWRWWTRLRREALLSLLAYGVLSLVFFAGPDLAHLSRVYLGWGTDPSTFVWYLRWWPHALANAQSPLSTHLLWAPQGIDLTAGTPIPGPSLVAAPLTLLAGPVVAYDVLMLLAPALSAWTAFLLARRLCGRFWPSLVGGYVFGFSTYELGRMLGHLNFALAFLIPLAVLVVLRRLEGGMSTWAFVAAVAAIVAGQFLISSEVLLTMTFFGGVTLLIGFLVAGRGGRVAILSAAGWLGLGYVVAGVIVSPLLIGSLGRALTVSPIYDFYPTFFSSDLLNFVVPTFLTRVNLGPLPVTERLTGNLSEQVAYLGLPLLAIVVAFGVQQWRTRAARVLLGILAVVAVASLGPKLHVGGKEKIWMPWKAVSGLPLFKYALPGRYMVYGFLAAGLIVALWLAQASRRPWLRWALAGLAVVSLLPNLTLGIWRTDVDTPAFFSTGIYRSYLRANENVLVIPYGDRGNSMMWQAQTGMAFRMPAGYVTVIPPKSFSAWPILGTFYDGTIISDMDAQLKGFVGAKRVGAVVVLDGYPGPWEQVFGLLDRAPVRVGGVTLYRVPAEILRAYANAKPPG
jgi:hypothetical protein